MRPLARLFNPNNIRIGLWWLVLAIPMLVINSINKQRLAVDVIRSQPPGTYSFPTTQPLSPQFDLRPAFPNLIVSNPVQLLQAPHDPARMFVVQQTGQVVWFENRPDCEQTRSFLDISQKLGDALDHEQGLLSLAFHPEFGKPESAHRGQIFVFYAGRDGDRLFNRLSRFELQDGHEQIDADSEFKLIDQTDPHVWHNAGCLRFGPDGYLYVSLGDGGGVQDEFRNGQAIDKSLFSGVIRIDIDNQSYTSHRPPRQPKNGTTVGYSIPNDNPFVGMKGVLEEFWSIGFRNPHRMAFDRETSELWVGDVGSLGSEEIDIARPGSNHLWSLREGDVLFESSPINKERNRPLHGTPTPPLYAYGNRTLNACVGEGYCIIGGFVYRGQLHPALRGKYLYGDFGTGNIFALEDGVDIAAPQKVLQMPSSGNFRMVSLETDVAGEIYVIAGADAGEDFTIWKLTKVADASAQALPVWLSETDLFTSLKPLVPAPTLFGYDITVPFWSNGALKRRWIKLPDQQQIEIGKGGKWQFPEGTVFVKHFTMTNKERPTEERPLETRILVVQPDCSVYGATWKWNEDSTDAKLVDPDGTTIKLGQTGIDQWHVPARSQCLPCHNQHAGYILGFTSNQVNTQTLISCRAFSDLVATLDLGNDQPLTPMEDEYASIGERARSWLHANCAYCHQPGANIRAWFDLRRQTPLEQTGLINGEVANNINIAGAKAIVPGDPTRSILYQRLVHPHAELRMPPLGNELPDSTALALIRQWIGQMQATSIDTR